MKKNENLIYVKESDVPITTNRKQLLRYFLRGKSIPTYSDIECTKLQCDGKGESGKGSSRSITELHLIVKSRFPITSLEGVVKIVNDFIKEDNAVILIWCNKINKVVVKYQPNKSAEWMTSYSKKNYYNSKGVDGYSLADYEKMIQNEN
jgi:hypothetical protein